MASVEALVAQVQADEFTAAYLEAALWSSSDENHETFDGFSFYDVSVESLEQVLRDCAAFKERAAPFIRDENYLRVTEGTVEAQAGYDFWMTRNHHGVGFWEAGDWESEAGAKLTEIADSFRECNVTEENGTLYIE